MSFLKKHLYLFTSVVFAIVCLINGKDPFFPLIVFLCEVFVTIGIMWFYLSFLSRNTREIVSSIIGGLIVSAVAIVMLLAAFIVIVLPGGLLLEYNHVELSSVPSLFFLDTMVRKVEMIGFKMYMINEFLSFYFTKFWSLVLFVPEIIVIIWKAKRGEIKYQPGQEMNTNSAYIQAMIRPLKESAAICLFALLAAVPVFLLWQLTSIYVLHVALVFGLRVLIGAVRKRKR